MRLEPELFGGIHELAGKPVGRGSPGLRPRWLHARAVLRRGDEPLVAELEPRQMLATITWTGNAANDFWHTAANWDLGRVPAATDDVVIPSVAGSSSVQFNATTGAVSVLSINATEPFAISGGSLTVTNTAGATFNGTFTLSGGAVTGNAWTFNGSFTQTGGTATFAGLVNLNAAANTSSGGNFAGLGALVVNNGSLLTFSGGVRSINDLNINVRGFGTLSWTATNTTLSNDARIVVDGNGTFNIDSSGGTVVIQQGTGTVGFVNMNGTLNKNGANSASIGLPVFSTDTGLVNVNAGSLTFSAGDGTDTTDMDFTVDPGCLLGLEGDWQFSTASQATGGGETRLSNGTATTTASNIATSRVTISSAVVLGAAAQWANLTVLDGANISGGFVISTTTLVWSGGTIGGGIGATLSVNGNATISGAAAKVLSRTLTLAGSASFSAAALEINVGRVNTVSGASPTFTFLGTVDAVITGVGDARWENSEAIVKNGPGNLLFTGSLAYDGSGFGPGSFAVNAGTVQFDGSVGAAASPCDDNFTIAAGAQVVLSGPGAKRTASSAAWTGAGDLSITSGGSVSFDGDLILTGDVVISGASFLTSIRFLNFGGTRSSANLTVNSGDVVFGTTWTVSGTVTINGGQVDTFGQINTWTLVQTGGSLQGSNLGNLTLNSGSFFRGGSWLGSGTVFIPTGATVTLDTAAMKTIGRPVSVAGQMALADGDVTLSNATLTIGGGSGVLSIAGPRRVLDGGLGAIASTSNIIKTGAGVASIAVPVNQNNANTADITVSAGTLELTGGGTHAGDFQIAAGATLVFGGGSHSCVAGQAMTGTGTVRVTAGLLSGLQSSSVSHFEILSGAVTLAPAGPFSSSVLSNSGGTLTLSAPEWTTGTLNMSAGAIGGTGGSLRMTSTTAPSSWSGGSIGGPGSLISNMGVTLNINAGAAARTLARTFQAAGPIVVNGASFTLSNAQIIAGGTTIFTNAPGQTNTITAGGAISQIFWTSNATFTGGGTWNILAETSHSAGTLSVQGGTAVLAAGGQLQAAVNLSNAGAARARLELGGARTLAASSAFTVTNSDLISRGTVTSSALFTTTGGTLEIENGSWTQQTPIAITDVILDRASLSLPAPVLDLNAALTVSGAVRIGNGSVRPSVNQSWPRLTMDNVNAGLSGAGSVAITNTFTWTRGAVGGLSGAGTMTIGGTAVVNGASAADARTLSTTLTNNGTANLGNITFAGGNPSATPRIVNGGTLNLGGGTFSLASGATTGIVNNATMNVVAGTTVALNAPVVQNPSGSMILAGTVTMASPVSPVLQAGGIISVQPGAVLTMQGNATYAGATVGNSGTMRLLAGTHTISNISSTGTLRVGAGSAANLQGGTLGGSVQIDGGTTLTLSGVTTDLSAGLVVSRTAGTGPQVGVLSATGAQVSTLAGTVQFTDVRAEFSGAALSGSGNISFAGSGGLSLLALATYNPGQLTFGAGTDFNFSAGQLAGGAARLVVIQTGATMTLPATALARTLARTLNVSGVATHVNGILRVDAAAINLAPGSSYLVQNNASIDQVSAASINAAGSIIKTGAVSNVRVPVNLQTSGELRVDSGSLELNAGLQSVALSDVRVSAAGALLLGLSSTLNGTLLTAGTLVVSFGQSLTLGGSVTWTGGTWTVGSPGVTIASTGVLLASGSGSKFLAGVLSVAGIFNVSGTAPQLAASGSTVINVVSGGVLVVLTSTVFSGPGSGGIVVDNGAIEIAASAGDVVTIATPLSTPNPTSRVSVFAGTLNITGPLAQLGGGTLSAGDFFINDGTLDFPIAITTLAGTASVSLGSPISNVPDLSTLGTLDTTTSSPILSLSNGAQLTLTPLGGTLVNEGRILLDAGSVLAIAGAYTQTAGAQLETRILSTSSFGRIGATGQVTLAGNAIATFVDGFVPAIGNRFAFVAGLGGRLGTFGAVSVFGLPGVSIREDYGPGDAAILAEAPPSDPLDFNGDGLVNIDDISDYITAYFSVPPDPRTDFNGDGFINVDDVSDFITAYFGR